ncbi:MAG: four helix bundle protein [Reichenbachiella sp.]|uniref:four helix bundle protein n=1 Tax=Reichenbachiella sp. TaxID=2184521 RepID=UPI0032659DD4
MNNRIESTNEKEHSKTKSYDFALDVINEVQVIKNNHKEFDLSRQLVRSGTAIGALIREAEFGQTKKDFIHKLSISLKEANETDYWLNLLKDAGLITQESFQELAPKCEELLKMLVASIKTARSN